MTLPDPPDGANEVYIRAPGERLTRVLVGPTGPDTAGRTVLIGEAVERHGFLPVYIGATDLEAITVHPPPADTACILLGAPLEGRSAIGNDDADLADAFVRAGWRGAPLLLLGYMRHGGSGAQGVSFVKLEQSDESILRAVDHWLRALRNGGRATSEPARGALEALIGWVDSHIVENDALRLLVDEFEHRLGRAHGELTEAHIELRALKARLEQVELANEALRRELRQAQIQPESASLWVRALRVAAVAGLNGLTAFAGGAGAVLVTADTPVQVPGEVRVEVEARCDQTINIIDLSIEAPR